MWRFGLFSDPRWNRREEAQRQAVAEKEQLVAAQNETRMVCASAQREADECMELVEDLERKLEAKQVGWPFP